MAAAAVLPIPEELPAPGSGRLRPVPLATSLRDALPSPRPAAAGTPKSRIAKPPPCPRVRPVPPSAVAVELVCVVLMLFPVPLPLFPYHGALASSAARSPAR